MAITMGAALTVHTEGSHLELPSRSPRPEDDQLPAFPAAEEPVGAKRTVLRPAGYQRRITQDLSKSGTTVTAVKDLGWWRIDAMDLTGEGITEETYSIRPDEPMSARAESGRAIH